MQKIFQIKKILNIEYYNLFKIKLKNIYFKIKLKIYTLIV